MDCSWSAAVSVGVSGARQVDKAVRRFRNGAVVTIFRPGPKGLSVEGRADVRRGDRKPDYFRVILAGAARFRSRLVLPNGHASVAPPEIGEFFPTDVNGAMAWTR